AQRPLELRPDNAEKERTMAQEKCARRRDQLDECIKAASEAMVKIMDQLKIKNSIPANRLDQLDFFDQELSRIGPGDLQTLESWHQTAKKQLMNLEEAVKKLTDDEKTQDQNENNNVQIESGKLVVEMELVIDSARWFVAKMENAKKRHQQTNIFHSRYYGNETFGTQQQRSDSTDNGYRSADSTGQTRDLTTSGGQQWMELTTSDRREQGQTPIRLQNTETPRDIETDSPDQTQTDHQVICVAEPQGTPKEAPGRMLTATTQVLNKDRQDYEEIA
uniref:Tektin n=1 Tax=Steinernema glaseri TaxID=37863 RepID=A0A1I7Y770_9BILA